MKIIQKIFFLLIIIPLIYAKTCFVDYDCGDIKKYFC